LVKLFGIKNCSTVKKALNWLDENSIEYGFVDVKKKHIERRLKLLV